ncbi:hypothetical protein IFM89_039918 [Coptis chinensis]|uniref:DUF4283 domain-containing protein n=1 Tax=Coptis chinensis TaxID=261450 RepID=A0A835LCN0_9MAGN|nr:hypothetical protein IFM89_039918 [Coptis chinensis]
MARTNQTTQPSTLNQISSTRDNNQSTTNMNQTGSDSIVVAQNPALITTTSDAFALNQASIPNVVASNPTLITSTSDAFSLNQASISSANGVVAPNLTSFINSNGFFLEKRLPFLIVRDLLRKRWKLKGNFEMVADEELFYFKFSNSDDRNKVLETGSVYISGRCFVISKWSQDIERRRNLVQLIPIWVNLHNAPKELWTDDGLSYLPESSCFRTIDGEVVTGGTSTASNEQNLIANCDVGVTTDAVLDQDIDQSTETLTQEA